METEPLIRVGILTDGRPLLLLYRDYIEVQNVVIGRGFHWEQPESLCYRGTMEVRDDTLINTLPLEKYVWSVVNAEMNARSPMELLKAHAVIARSWALAQVRNPPHGEAFDVCSDDHCQRYQGIGTRPNLNLTKALELTRGEVLTYNGALCDARYSKCCGGAAEQFSTCWEDVDIPYLAGKQDCAEGSPAPLKPLALNTKEGAEAWILSSPPAYCNVDDPLLLRRFLTEYDRPTADFYRWTVRYSSAELTQLVHRMHPEVGQVLRLVPLQRGVSGRICQLRVYGTEGSVDVGKELTIRKLLSPSHLYSSAFVVQREGDDFVLRGAGWGHGVGLCQIGAAHMAVQGADYREILLHYYPHTELHTLDYAL